MLASGEDNYHCWY